MLTIKKVSNSEKNNSKKSDEKIIAQARKHFNLCVDGWNEQRKKALDDFQFRIGDQWPDEIKRERLIDGRPCLTINRIPQFIRQITNDQRQNRPTIKISPVDDKADIETAKIYQGLIRHIWVSSNADVAIDTSLDHSATGGFGFFRIKTDYVSPYSFDLEAKFERISNLMSVYFDPSSKEPDGSDSNFAFIFDELTEEDYKNQYPDSDLSSMQDWKSLGDNSEGWISDKAVRVAEYFYREFEEITLVMLPDGQVFKSDDLEEIPEGSKQRKAKIPVVKWLKLNGVEVLEETIWPGSYIPVIPVYGEEIIVNGERHLEGVVRHAKDPQRMYNYWKSTETESITLAPKAPFIGYAGQFEGFESQWAQANKKPKAFLEANATTEATGSQILPLPQRNSIEPAVAAISNASMLASEDMKATTGIYDAALGNRSNEQSGIAIQRRNIQSQTSNFHLIDNLSRSIRHAGKILLEIIPQIYDAPRVARIIGEEGNEEVILLNQLFQYKGKPTQFNLNVGQYDVVVETGPSFATKRQEAAASMADLTRSYPQLMQVAGDLLVKNLDWPGASEIAERIKKTLPPGIVDDPNKKPIPPEVQSQMQQMDQMIKMLTDKVNEQSEIIKTKHAELESKERIEFAKMQVDLQKKQMEIAPSQAMETVMQELAKINTRLQLLDINEPFDNEFNESGLNESAIHQEQQNIQPTDGFHQV